MTTQEAKSATLSGNEQLQQCAERAREAERLAQEADTEAGRLRKEVKRVRKAYKSAKKAAKAAAKTAAKARGELSECLDGAFRQLATALQDQAALQESSARKPPVLALASSAGTGEVLPLPTEPPSRATLSG